MNLLNDSNNHMSQKTKIEDFISESVCITVRSSFDRIIVFNEYSPEGLVYNLADMEKIINILRQNNKFIIWEIINDNTIHIYESEILCTKKLRIPCMQPFDSLEVIILYDPSDAVQKINDLVISIMKDIQLRTIYLRLDDRLLDKKEEILEYYTQLCEKTGTELVYKT